MPGPTRQDTYAVTVWVEDPATGILVDIGIFDKMTGGEVDSDNTTYRPGNMGDPVDMGGTRTVSNVVVSRLARLGGDLASTAVMRRVRGAGNARMRVSKQPLTIEGVKEGGAIVYNGTLKRVAFPEVDSESTSAGLIELEMTIKGFPSAS